MISGQVDRLRTAAQTYRRLGNHSAESMLLDAADTIWELRDDNAKLREQMERLVTLLRADCDIDASWDGLRRFWSIDLTEGGCLMRDRACKAEGDNAKLRESVKRLMTQRDERLARAEAENAKLRELVSGLEYCVQGFVCDGCPLYDPSGTNHRRCESLERELGIEVAE